MSNRVYLQEYSSVLLNKSKVILCLLCAGLILAGCSWSRFGATGSTPKLSPKIVEYGQRVPKGGGVYKIGSPYQIDGRWYRPREEPNYDEVGVASWYGLMFHGRYTANREIYDMDALTAAHPTLPLPSYVRVTNRNNGRSLILRVNDRGPYANDRIIDLSRKAARLLGFEKGGTAPVRVTYLRPAPLNGDDSLERRYLAQQRWAKPRRRRYSRRRYSPRRHSQRRYSKRRYSQRRSQSRCYARRQNRRRYDSITTGSINRRRARRIQRGYIVQAGIFQSRWNANRMRGKVSRYGRTYIETQQSRSYPLYRVMLGPYRNRDQAMRVADRISFIGVHDAIVMRN